MLIGSPVMTLTLQLSPAEALALRDALALSGRKPDYSFTLDPLWDQVSDFIDDLAHQGGLSTGACSTSYTV